MNTNELIRHLEIRISSMDEEIISFSGRSLSEDQKQTVCYLRGKINSMINIIDLLKQDKDYKKNDV